MLIKDTEYLERCSLVNQSLSSEIKLNWLWSCKSKLPHPCIKPPTVPLLDWDRSTVNMLRSGIDSTQYWFLHPSSRKCIQRVIFSISYYLTLESNNIILPWPAVFKSVCYISHIDRSLQHHCPFISPSHLCWLSSYLWWCSGENKWLSQCPLGHFYPRVITASLCFSLCPPFEQERVSEPLFIIYSLLWAILLIVIVVWLNCKPFFLKLFSIFCSAMF